jgi:hypothetical protein
MRFAPTARSHALCAVLPLRLCVPHLQEVTLRNLAPRDLATVALTGPREDSSNSNSDEQLMPSAQRHSLPLFAFSFDRCVHYVSSVWEAR